MNRPSLMTLLVLPLVLPFVVSCNDDGKADDTTSGSSSTEQGDGDGDNSGDGDGDNTGDGDGDPACNLGELNCGCNGGQCLGDLECVNDTCVASCIPGEQGCECNNGQCLGDLECTGDVCTDPNCTPGELGCECNGGQCLGDLECVGNLCMEGSGDGDGDGDGDGEPPCPNPNEMMCDGDCIDVMANNDNCGSCGTVCNWIEKGTPDMGSCVAGACTPMLKPCVTQADGFVSCDDVCASHGETCANQACDANTNVFTDNMVACNSGNVATGSTLNCASPIMWPFGDWVGCCCTQSP